MTEQKKTDPLWKDETGMQIPFTRTTASERLRERTAHSILKKANIINEELKAFKEIIKKASDEVYNSILKEEKTIKKDTKGNFTWYSFDRGIKVEVAINERIEFDEILIGLCKQKLDEFIDDNLSGVDSFVKSLVNDAFHNTKGRLDSKKVMSLLKHRSKIKDHRYQEAMEHLEKSIKRPDSKTYYRIAVKNEEGKYDYVELNFSSI